VPQHGDELLAQFRTFALAEERSFAARQLLMHVQMCADQLGKELEHPERLAGVQPHRTRVDRT
jgi:hypothetical protein